jgi:putative pyruvate formate lyase activating enzyme
VRLKGVMDMTINSSYLDLQSHGELEKRVELLFEILESCELCPRKCGVNRLEDELGYCKMGRDLVVSSFGPHFGEEKELVGIYGSGTIFLAGCSLLCIYCQNYEISNCRVGKKVSLEKVADFMLSLQKSGCHNINLVTPTHFAAQLVKSIAIGVKKGLKIPIVWNCSGYENIEIIKLLEGIVDIYLPDIKYGTKEPAKKYSNAANYFEKAKEAVNEMYRQVGNLKFNKQGIAYRGVIIRHLILPENKSGSEAVLTYIRGLSENMFVNIMSQYRPEGIAYQYKEIDRCITTKEYGNVMQIVKKLGLKKS